jgi:hypothetical protein
MNSIIPSDLRRPTDYKSRYEREQGRRQHFERRVEVLTTENKALRWDLQEARRALALAEAELRRRGMTPQARQGHLMAVGG